MPGLRFLRAELPRRALPALSSACLRVVETGAAIALVAVDAADRDTCKLFEIGDDGAAAFAGHLLQARSSHCFVSLPGLSTHTNGSLDPAVTCRTLSCSCAASFSASSRVVRPALRLSHITQPLVRGWMAIALGPV